MSEHVQLASPTRRRYLTPEGVDQLDVPALERDLAAAVDGGIRFDAGSRAAYATDASNFRQPPIGVVEPRRVEDLVAAVAVCRSHNAPITHRGGGTSLAGQATNVAVIIDSSRYLNRIVDIDPQRRQAVVEPGVVLDDLRDAAAPHGLTFAPDPSTHDRCTIGGMVGNNACGVHSLRYGRTSENVDALDVLLYDGTRLAVGAAGEHGLDQRGRAGGRVGEIYHQLAALRDRAADLIRERFPPGLPRRVSGYNLDELLPERDSHVARALVGTEGTCVSVLGATLRLVATPAARVLVVLGFDSLPEAADRVPAVLEHQPTGLEGIDHVLIDNMHRKGMHLRELGILPDGRDYLLVELAGETLGEAERRADSLSDAVAVDSAHVARYDDPDQARRTWQLRESGLGASAQVPGRPDAWPGWEDSAVPPQRLGAYIRDLLALYDEFGLEAGIYGHFGDGCIHTRINFDLDTHPGVERYERFLEAAADLVVAHGGSCSGEHGDGQQRTTLLARQFGAEVVAEFRAFKAIWDPGDRMNPGKGPGAPAPAGPADNLRLGPQRHWNEQRPAFALVDDEGSFGRATLRCVGVGKCRRSSGGVMCPSYMVTGDEVHSTRGRARVLFEMMEGELITDGWRSEAVHDALDLCLSCKGCKRDCPVAVDMAKYKAEFLSRYYRRRMRPRPAYAMGLIMLAARAGGRAPRLANALLHGPVVSSAIKRAAGISVSRAAPRFARRTLQHWARGREASGGEPVVLFPDTFVNHFEPEIGIAVHELLRAGGYDVRVPSGFLCCARPAFDYGMLDLARRLYRRTLDRLRPAIRAGIPVVVCEPSCAASFADELVAMYPHDTDALRLAELTTTVGQLVDSAADRWPFEQLDRDVYLWRHCHQHAVLDVESDVRVLERLGCDVRVGETSCCGLAGSWGFEADKYDLSMRCAELELFPTLRTVDRDTAVVADGFSCRTQIAHGDTGRRATHLGELLRDALPENVWSCPPAGTGEV